MKIYVGSDHAGLEMKLKVMAELRKLNWQDMGTFSADSVDYPDFADKVCKHIVQVELENQKNSISDSLEGSALGILICGSGQGMAIRANKYPQIRAALCWNEAIATLSREHNNANILCLSGRMIPLEENLKMITAFLNTKFAGGRHAIRVDKLSSDTGC
ncbi:MAG: RpiB/LacA/LacB family sugar-phosphate isomerase [Bdellovibrio sp.]|nr:RpiB/LacA/LacB family sugar-phosphate isomerase [Bdellovibrio sp.]